MNSNHDVAPTELSNEQLPAATAVSYESPVVERLGNWQLVTLVGSIDIL